MSVCAECVHTRHTRRQENGLVPQTNQCRQKRAETLLMHTSLTCTGMRCSQRDGLGIGDTLQKHPHQSAAIQWEKHLLSFHRRKISQQISHFGSDTFLLSLFNYSISFYFSLIFFLIFLLLQLAPCSFSMGYSLYTVWLLCSSSDSTVRPLFSSAPLFVVAPQKTILIVFLTIPIYCVNIQPLFVCTTGRDSLFPVPFLTKI